MPDESSAKTLICVPPNWPNARKFEKKAVARFVKASFGSPSGLRCTSYQWVEPLLWNHSKVCTVLPSQKKKLSKGSFSFKGCIQVGEI